MRRFTISTPLVYLYLNILGYVESKNENNPIFAFFEGPIPGEEEYGSIGPSVWKDLSRIDQNHCGGNGQKNGFGQSPIKIPFQTIIECDRNVNEFEHVKDPTCKFDDIDFRVTKDGLRAYVPTDESCHLGEFKIPGSSDVFQATDIRVTYSSDHSYDGYFSEAEMQLFCREKSHDEIVVFSLLLDVVSMYGNSTVSLDDFTANENPIYESFLKGWEAYHNQTEEFCAINPKGTKKFVAANTAIKSQHTRKCHDIGSGVDLSGIIFHQHLEFPKLHQVNFAQDQVPNLLKNQTGYYSYKGSLTTPPCTENVHWNIGKDTMILSLDQVFRTEQLILCFVERSNCQHGSAASQFFTTTRPPQSLNGRPIIHYCDYQVINNPIPKAPEIDSYEMPHVVKSYYGVIFPWFVSLLGVCLFYLLTRFLHGVPYTAALFLVGTIMGIGVSYHESHNHLHMSTRMWQYIDSELLLLVFLPGLLFKDAYSLEIHIFQKSFAQCLIMGFPMVLCGTYMMAVVGKYVLPYDWSTTFALIFGSIVSATDPVAVGALLNELGAPPRLKMHIAGESLLNDGSAYVFFTIFKTIHLNEINLHGEAISYGKGFLLFFKMSLGAMALGSLFGLGLSCILFILKRRLNKEENIVQVSATITFAYLTYYVAESTALHLSGVIAVVFCGIVVKKFACHTISDQQMMSKFWALVEHLLNTVLFVLGGVVWGSVMSNSTDNVHQFKGKDYGYWLLAYVLMTVVRFILFGLFYPLMKRIGLKTNMKETIFQAFGGLRGAIGIALAISLDNKVMQDTFSMDPRRESTSELFAVTGWMALMTLFINGVLAGPLLRKLRLHRASDARDKMIEHFNEQIRVEMLKLLIKLLGEPRFFGIDYNILKMHVTSLKLDELTDKELMFTVRQVKESSPLHIYKKPDLSIFDEYFSERGKKTELEAVNKYAKVKMADVFRRAQRSLNLLNAELDGIKVGSSFVAKADEEYNKEVRLVFIELLRYAYGHDMEIGDIAIDEMPVVSAIDHSVSITKDRVHNNHSIQDWEPCKLALQSNYVMRYCERYDKEMADIYAVHLASAFINAHEEAEENFKLKFCKVGNLTSAEWDVLNQSSEQISLARAWLHDEVEPSKRKKIMGYLLANIILNHEAGMVKDFVENGLLKESEGEHHIEHIERKLELIKRESTSKRQKKYFLL